MPSLPLTLAAPTTLMTTSHASNSHKCREVEYHLNGRDRYVAQSYEVRSPSHHSHIVPPASPRSMQHPLSSKYSSLRRSAVRLERFKPKAGKSVVVVQSRECVLQDQAHTKAKAVKSSELTTPSPTPRPRRLPTPDLSDIDDDRPFCRCDSRKDCTSASCQRDLR